MPEGLERVDLLVNLHAPKLRGERGPGASRHDDGGHERGHFPHHADADEVRYVGRRAEFLHLGGPDERQDQSHEKGDQSGDRQRAGAGLPQRHPEIAPVEGAAPARQAQAAQNGLPEISPRSPARRASRTEPRCLGVPAMCRHHPHACQNVVRARPRPARSAPRCPRAEFRPGSRLHARGRVPGTGAEIRAGWNPMPQGSRRRTLTRPLAVGPKRRRMMQGRGADLGEASYPRGATAGWGQLLRRRFGALEI